MKIAGTIAIIAVLTASTASGQVMNPNNGHFYQAFPGGIRWDDARTAAEASTFMGMPGHLATIADATENDWVYNNLGLNVDRFWLGLFQDPTDPGFVEPGGGFVWTTGEPVGFTQWNLPNEPNNFPGAGPEDFVAFDNNPNWNDAPIDWVFNAGYIVEYDTAGGMEFCNGDGGNQMGCTNCPCGNNATPGTIGGCLNSAGTSTRMLRSGTDSIAAADLRFEASGAPPLNSCQLTSGDAQAPANLANPCFGLNSGVQSVNLDGLRCAVQSVLRHGVRPSDANGDVGVTTNGWGTPNGFFNFGAFTSGATKHFQIIHRDDATTVCLTGQNTSQGISVTFTP